MNELFLDASFVIALAVPADQHHAKASDLKEKIRLSNTHLITTLAVALEIGNALSGRKYRDAAASLLDALDHDPDIEVVAVDQGLYERGLEFYRSRSDKEWGLTDCISFVVMHERGLTDALTTDRHFQQAGFRALLRDN